MTNIKHEFTKREQRTLNGRVKTKQILFSSLVLHVPYSATSPRVVFSLGLLSLLCIRRL
jgi:hypothetical protein